MKTTLCIILILALINLSTAIDGNVTVFEIGESGYFCHKIPYILQTHNGTLLAWAESRVGSCSDYAKTDLTQKRSVDGGKTWSDLMVVHSMGSPSIADTIGNAGPVQLKSGRILFPHNLNNSICYNQYSDDDGQSWSTPTVIQNVEIEGAHWVGLGPPAGLLLKSGRILIPSYHSYEPNDNGEFSWGHVMVSDDDGDTWHVEGLDFGRAQDHHSNEAQAVQLKNGSILINSRRLLEKRMQIRSDDEGKTWGESWIIENIPEPISGCEGSTVTHEPTGHLYYSGVAGSNWPLKIYRVVMNIWKSEDEGKTWKLWKEIDPGSVSYSAMTISLDQKKIGCLWEQSDTLRTVFQPDRIVWKWFDLDEDIVIE